MPDWMELSDVMRPMVGEIVRHRQLGVCEVKSVSKGAVYWRDDVFEPARPVELDIVMLKENQYKDLVRAPANELLPWKPQEAARGNPA